MPYGPVGHEGDALIGCNKEKFVLESHESGPEVVINLTTASIALITAVIALIATFLNVLPNENRKRPDKINILRKRLIKNKVVEEDVIEVELPVTDKVLRQLENKLKKTLEQDMPPGESTYNQSSKQQESSE